MSNIVILVVLNAFFILGLFLFKNIFIAIAFSLVFAYLLIRYYPVNSHIHHKINLEKIAQIGSDRTLLFLLISLIVFIGLEDSVGFSLAFLAAFFLFFRLAKLASSACYKIALSLLMVTAISAGFGNQDVTKFLAVLVYYFLIIGLLWQLGEIIIYHRKGHNTLLINNL